MTSKHRRAVRRHIDTLVSNGVIQRLDVGERKIRCLRLAKYDSDLQPATLNANEGSEDDSSPDEEIPKEQGSLSRELPAGSQHEPFQQVDGAPLTTSIEHEMHHAIVRSGQRGLSISVSWR